jgi:hypothetical protein
MTLLSVRLMSNKSFCSKSHVLQANCNDQLFTQLMWSLIIKLKTLRFSLKSWAKFRWRQMRVGLKHYEICRCVGRDSKFGIGVNSGVLLKCVFMCARMLMGLRVSASPPPVHVMFTGPPRGEEESGKLPQAPGTQGPPPIACSYLLFIII